MFEEKGHEEQDSSTDDEKAMPEEEKPEVINVDEGEPSMETQPLTRNQKRKQEERGERRAKQKQTAL